MTNTSNDPSSSLAVSETQKQSKKSLQEFFQQKSVKHLVSVFVPGILAAALFPFFPPVATVAAAAAVKNGLEALHVSLSIETIEKILKPLEGKSIEESDIQEVLDELLPKDKQVNEETAKVLVTVVPTIKETVLSNSKLDVAWLAESLEANLKQQGAMMEKIAPDIRILLQKDGVELVAEMQRLLHNWSRISLEVTAINKSKIVGLDLKAKSEAGTIDYIFKAQDESTIDTVKTNFEIS
jgi:hypothetical protein